MSWYSNKRILITGGAGFIGSHIAETLITHGAHVVILDNLSTGRIENLYSINEHPNFTFIKGDISDKALTHHATENCDVIFHCAAFTSAPDSVTHPAECFRSNVVGTHNVLDAAIKNNVRSFVFSSSAAVYGSRSAPCVETDTCAPQSPYGASKIEGEKLCSLYSKQYGINTTILRYFNVYGPRQSINNSYAAVVAAFNNLLLAGKPLTIFGSGLQTRDFIAVHNVVEANLLMGMQPSMQAEIFNIGTGRSINLFELIGNLAQTINPKKIELFFAPARDGDVLNSAADCTKYEQFASSNSPFTLQFKKVSRSGETGRHARFRV